MNTKAMISKINYFQSDYVKDENNDGDRSPPSILLEETHFSKSNIDYSDDDELLYCVH